MRQISAIRQRHDNINSVITERHAIKGLAGRRGPLQLIPRVAGVRVRAADKIYDKDRPAIIMVGSVYRWGSGGRFGPRRKRPDDDDEIDRIAPNNLNNYYISIR